uniref:Uncharacterized protein n=1 Tax=Rhizophora mucronata TaxID=61149 RepID=A0A2P2LBG2_RHIMU
MVVGVKPLGHFHSRYRGVSSSHGEINIKSNLTTIPAISLGNSTKHGCGVQNLVIVRKSVAWNIFDSSISHLLPNR